MSASDEYYEVEGLEAIEERLKWAKVFSPDDVRELLVEIKQLRRRMNRIVGLEAQNRRLREALEWYAKSTVNRENQVARRALEDKP